MGVGDGTVILGRAAFGVVTVDRRLFNGILDLLTVSVPIQVGPLHRVGVILVIGHFQLVGIRRGDVGAVGLQDQIFLEIFGRRPLAVLVGVVFPDLLDLDIGETILVGIGHVVVDIRSLDGTGRGLRSGECGIRFFDFDFVALIIPGPRGELRALECIVGRQCAFRKGIRRIGGEVEETEVVAGLQVDNDICSAGGVVEAGPAAVFHFLFSAGYEGINVTAVPDGEPDPVIGVEIVCAAVCRFGVNHVQCELEGLFGIRVFPVDDLREVEAGTAVVGRGQPGGCEFICIVVFAARDGTAGRNRILYRTFRCRVLFVDQDQRGLGSVDDHGTNGGDVKLPVISQILGLLECEVVARGQKLNVAAVFIRAHDADGDEHAVFPIVVIRKSHGVFIGAVHQDREGDGLSLLPVQRVFPLLGYEERLNSGRFDRIRILKCLVAFRAGTGVFVFQRGGGIGRQVSFVVDVILDVCIQVIIGTGIIFDIGYDIKRLLAGIDVEGHGVGHVVQQGADVIEIPVYRAGAFIKHGLRRIEVIEGGLFGPLHLDDVAGFGALIRSGSSIPGDVDVVPVHRGGALDLRTIDKGLECVRAGGNVPGEPVLKGLVVNLQELCDAGAGLNLVGSTVVDGNVGNADGLDDRIGDGLKCRFNVLGAVGVEVQAALDAVSLGGIAVVAVADGGLHVGLIGTEGEDTVEGGFVRGIVKLIGLIVCGIVVCFGGRATVAASGVVMGVACCGRRSTLMIGGLAV